jgi:hypothetical protein
MAHPRLSAFDRRVAVNNDFAVVTTSFRPDFRQFCELRRSVELHVPPDIPHYVIVPTADVEFFSELSGVIVVDEARLLPRSYRKVPGKNWHVQLRRPWWPIRGWVLQQVLKMAVTERLDVEHVVIADSDCVFVRDLRDAEDLRFVARRGGVTSSLPRHVIWHEIARTLLGLPADSALPKTDYVSSVTTWSPAEMVALTRRITATCGAPWYDVVTSLRHFSEFTVYGVFVEHLGSAPQRIAERWACEHWDERPLDHDAGMALADRLASHDAALMISAKSGTPEDVRLATIDRARSVAKGLPRPN